MTDRGLSKTLEPLRALYDKTGVDWSIEVHHCLTEPTCPTVIIRPEGLRRIYWRFDAETIEEAIQDAAAFTIARVLQGEATTPSAPFSLLGDGLVGDQIVTAIEEEIERESKRYNRNMKVVLDVFAALRDPNKREKGDRYWAAYLLTRLRSDVDD